MPSYLKKRGKKYHFQRRVPAIFQTSFKDPLIRVSLQTDSQTIAMERARNVNLLLDEFLEDLRSKISNEFEDHGFKKAVIQLRKAGFQYVPKTYVVQEASLIEFANRIKAASVVEKSDDKKLLLGEQEVSGIKLSEAQIEYFQFQLGNLSQKSENQLRKWRTPREKAVRNFMQLVGNKQLKDITRQDILDFRDWWSSRIKKENLTANSANKDFGHLKRILSFSIDNHELDMSIDHLFRDIALKRVEKTTRHPFSNDFIRDVLLKVHPLNDELIYLIYAMTETGARISELVGLEKEDICLNHEIPHIRIRPNQTRLLKTPQSERDIPLVGAAHYAFERLNGTFDRYFNSADLISTTTNKYFRENDIFPSENHSLYSLRHSFEDRLTAVEPPDKLQAALMGHKYSRPRYGSGPSLQQKLVWLNKIAFEVPFK